MTSSDTMAWLNHLNALLDFQRTGDGLSDWAWKCGGPETATEETYDRLYLAKQAAANLNLNFASLMASMDIHACCDCEIIFNTTDDGVWDDGG
jgi:hypothetical protein